MMRMTLILLGLFSAAQARDTSYLPDAFGYQQTQSCTVNYLDISADAQTLNLVAASDKPANDEGGVVYQLLEPFKFYQHDETHLVVSSNGYLSFADSLSGENGGDYSNDCLFPSVPSNQPDSLKRVMPFHDDLESGADGEIRVAYYPSCPRSGLSPSSCTVVEWHQWRLRNDSQTFDFQVIMYHQTSELVFQYGSDIADTESASIGFQDAKRFSGQILSCDNPGVELSNQAYCFQNPLIFTHGFEALE